MTTNIPDNQSDINASWSRIECSLDGPCHPGIHYYSYLRTVRTFLLLRKPDNFVRILNLKSSTDKTLLSQNEILL